MRIILCDLNPKIVAEWQRTFGKLDNFEFKNQDITSLKADGIVAAGNSFGLMSGGVDYVYAKYFGEKLEKNLQAEIRKLPMRELLVGQTLIIPTGSKDISHMIYAPTMRVPLDISDTANPYLAFKAALIAAKDNNFKSILCPGLGTWAGKVLERDAALQMYTAYKDVFDKYPIYFNSIREAYLAHAELVGITNIKKRK